MTTLTALVSEARAGLSIATGSTGGRDCCTPRGGDGCAADGHVSGDSRHTIGECPKRVLARILNAQVTASTEVTAMSRRV
jgi:hypothetical protein